MTIMIAIDREWGGLYLYHGFGWRLCLGFVAITVLPLKDDGILEFAGNWAEHTTEEE